jgi:DNA-binding IclR family transcriptional regulator
VLKAFSTRDRIYGVTELAQKLNLSKSTMHRLLATLTAEHLIEQNPETGKYHLGLAIYDLAAAASAGFDLIEAVIPPMTVLRDRTGETVQVSVLDGREVVYVQRLDSTHTLRFFLKLGRRNWVHCTSTGKVLLAALPRPDLDRLLDGWDLPAVTPYTITDPELLKKELAEIRDLGFGQNRNEADIGTMSIGAPIRDAGGRAVAAISVAGPVVRVDANIHGVTYSVIEAAAVASRRLGFRGRGGK